MSARIRVGLLSLACLGIWGAALFDTLAFRRWAAEYVAETGSLNASTDQDWANFLLSTVAVSLAVLGIVFARGLAGRAVWRQDWVLVALFSMGGWFLLRDPAHPIVLLPAVEVVPVLPAVAICGLVATLTPWSTPNRAMQPTGAKRPMGNSQSRSQWST